MKSFKQFFESESDEMAAGVQAFLDEPDIAMKFDFPNDNGPDISPNEIANIMKREGLEIVKQFIYAPTETWRYDGLTRFLAIGKKPDIERFEEIAFSTFAHPDWEDRYVSLLYPVDINLYLNWPKFANFLKEESESDQMAAGVQAFLDEPVVGIRIEFTSSFFEYGVIEKAIKNAGLTIIKHNIWDQSGIWSVGDMADSYIAIGTKYDIEEFLTVLERDLAHPNEEYSGIVVQYPYNIDKYLKNAKSNSTET